MIKGTPASEPSALRTFLLNARLSGKLSIVNITSVIYIIVLFFTFKDVYHLMPDGIMYVQITGMTIIVINIYILHVTKNVPLTASVMLLCMFIIHMANINFAGGIETPHFTWIFIIPILAGGTMGWRGQIFFWFISVIGTVYYTIFPAVVDSFPLGTSMGYVVMTRLMCLTIFSIVLLTYDVTLSQKIKELRTALNLANFESSLFLGVFNTKAQSVILVDSTGKIERANTTAHNMFGYKLGEMLGKSVNSICHSGIDLSSKQMEDEDGKELLISTNNKDELWIECRSLKIKDEFEQVQTLLTIEDISNRKSHESELSYLAHFDYLTKLPNRLSMQDTLAEMITIGQRHGREFAVVFIDLDKFKHINDVQGHEVGDSVLIEIAARLINNVRRGDVVARFGGDEFILLMDEVQSNAHIVSLVEHIKSTICQPITIKNNEYFVGCSVGISQFPQDGDDISDLLRKADTAMYKAKSLATGSYEFYNIEHDESIKRLITVGSELHYAIERDELSLLFQPIFDINDNISGAEALVRWKNEGLGRVSPDEFIPVSEDNGLIVPIGSWVLDQACQVLKTWRDMGYIDLTMSINVSYRQINNIDMVTELKRMLSKYQLDGSALILELTERVFVDDLSLVQQNISQFSQHGVQTAIDDFGVGYSNLGYLKKTDFTSIKIDRSFITDIEVNKSAEKLCKAITSMASSLGLSVTAEGIETKKQLDILKAMKVQKYQGFYMSKPLDSTAFEALLTGE